MNQIIKTEMTADGVIIDCDWEQDLDSIISSIEEHLEEAASFYQGTDLYLNIAGGKLSTSSIQQLITAMEGKLDVNTGIYMMSKATEAKPTVKEKVEKQRESIIKEEEVSFQGDTILIKGTLRSGQAVEHPHNLVVMGDVNPGAEVRAGGDIIVFGRLMGLVHAGAGGKKTAQVAALKLAPTQIRIANKISRPPEDNDLQAFRPEKAYIKDDMIVVEEINF
ncbi:MAG: septum site-determining protein MinC [Bacillota bacterium]